MAGYCYVILLMALMVTMATTVAMADKMEQDAAKFNQCSNECDGKLGTKFNTCKVDCAQGNSSVVHVYYL